jgi:hypothetical protein
MDIHLCYKTVHASIFARLYLLSKTARYRRKDVKKCNLNRIRENNVMAKDLKLILAAAQAVNAFANATENQETLKAEAETAVANLAEEEQAKFTAILEKLGTKETQEAGKAEAKTALKEAEDALKAEKAEKDEKADAKESWKKCLAGYKFTIAGVVAGAAILGTAHYYGVLAPAAEATFEAIAGVLAAASTTQLVIAAVAAIAVIGGAYYASQHWGKKEEAKENNEQAAGSAVGQ